MANHINHTGNNVFGKDGPYSPVFAPGTSCADGETACGEFRRGRKNGAGDRIRTGDIDLGKVALYQLSYSRVPGNANIVALQTSKVK
jgi:hypothetical protein